MSDALSSVADERIGLDLKAWFESVPGTLILDEEREGLRQILPDLFGYHIVEVGAHVPADLVAATRISHQIRFGVSTKVGNDATAIAMCNALPLDANSIDVVVLPHVLEFSADPHGVLREVERVLIGEGHVVIIGFNPWSLCGLSRVAMSWRGRAPWCGQFISVSRLKDWLKLLGFGIEFVMKKSFRPPVGHPKINTHLAFLEQLGRHLWPVFGNICMVLAKKRLAAVTPLKTSWRTRRRLIAGGVAEPTTRGPGVRPNSSLRHGDR